MNLALFLTGFGLGVLTGIWLWASLLGYLATRDFGRRRAAMVTAENRIRDAQADALNQLADAVAVEVSRQTGPSPTTWPSQRASDVLNSERRP